ncbi:MAG TPA: hypothetical protein VGL94_24085 [Ktedonobacteraceae bacterium]
MYQKLMGKKKKAENSFMRRSRETDRGYIQRSNGIRGSRLNPWEKEDRVPHIPIIPKQAPDFVRISSEGGHSSRLTKRAGVLEKIDSFNSDIDIITKNKNFLKTLTFKQTMEFKQYITFLTNAFAKASSRAVGHCDNSYSQFDIAMMEEVHNRLDSLLNESRQIRECIDYWDTIQSHSATIEANLDQFLPSERNNVKDSITQIRKEADQVYESILKNLGAISIGKQERDKAQESLDSSFKQLQGIKVKLYQRYIENSSNIYHMIQSNSARFSQFERDKDSITQIREEADQIYESVLKNLESVLKNLRTISTDKQEREETQKSLDSSFKQLQDIDADLGIIHISNIADTCSNIETNLDQFSLFERDTVKDSICQIRKEYDQIYESVLKNLESVLKNLRTISTDKQEREETQKSLDSSFKQLQGINANLERIYIIINIVDRCDNIETNLAQFSPFERNTVKDSICQIREEADQVKWTHLSRQEEGQF